MLVTIYIYHKKIVTPHVTKPPYAVNAKLKIVYLILEQSISLPPKRGTLLSTYKIFKKITKITIVFR